MGYIIVLLFVIVLVVIARNIRVVPQATAFIIERFGAYSTTWGAGLRFKTPFIDKVAKKMDLREQAHDFAPQPVITKDNVTVMIDTVVFTQIIDPKLYAYGVANPIIAIDKLTATTVRNIIGELDLDSCLTSREYINGKIQTIIDEATAPWGVKVTRVELRAIDPPATIKEAMEKQMRAERGKRESILQAEGERASAILSAEGAKQAAILRAEAEKEVQIREAEGRAQAAIEMAMAEAKAIEAVAGANASAIKVIKEAGADEAVLRLRGYEAFAKAADGRSNTMIIPSDIANLASVVGSLTTVAKQTGGVTLDENGMPCLTKV
jgi:regulator of protease activity HflC (stomatin/prohibitin superfamily)